MCINQNMNNNKPNTNSHAEEMVEKWNWSVRLESRRSLLWAMHISGDNRFKFQFMRVVNMGRWTMTAYNAKWYEWKHDMCQK